MFDAITVAGDGGFGRLDVASRGLTPSTPRIHAAASRLFDLVIAIVAIAFSSPLLLALAVLVRLSDGGPSLFGHRRIGRGGAAFRCLKFRSMTVDADRRLAAILEDDPLARAEWDRDHKLRVDPRVTAVGEFLRRSSLDELPQLFNVLRGEMSIVGPRPIEAAEIVRYGRRFSAYCSVKPGITGLWQVSGRNDVCYRRRVAMDALYAQKKSLALDLRIVVLTVPAILLARGSY